MNTQETLALLKQSLAKADPDLTKAWVQAASAVSGITAYDLEGPAKMLVPVLTPLRNSIPRVSGKGGIQANWRAVTGLNTTNMSAGLGEGQRNAAMVTSTADYIAVYRSIGIDDSVTFEAEFAGENFQDVRALATNNLLLATMLGEELLMLGGQGTYALAAITPTPTGTPSNAGGTMDNAHSPYSVYCAALTLEGYLASSVAAGIPQNVLRTNMGNTTVTYKGGSARISAVYQPTIGAGSSGSCACTVTAVPGAVAYAWFWGANGQAVKLGAITTTNAYTITTDVATGTQTISGGASNLDTASGYSQNSLVFDGLIAQAAKSGSGAYYKSCDNAKLTGDTYGGVAEINAMLKSMWDNYRLAPDVIYVNSQEKDSIRQAILKGSSSAAQRFMITMKEGELTGGAIKINYYNPFSMTEDGEAIPIKIHPNMPQGTILAVTHKLPYPLSNVTNVIQMRCRRDYYSIEWPMVNRMYEMGVYADEVLQHFFPPSMGLIQNVQPGVQ